MDFHVVSIWRENDDSTWRNLTRGILSRLFGGSIRFHLPARVRHSHSVTKVTWMTPWIFPAIISTAGPVGVLLKDAHPPQPEVPESSRSPSVPWPRRKFSSMTMAADSDTISSHRPMTTVSPSIDRASTIVLSTRKSHYQCSLFRKYSNFNFSFAPSMVALPLAIARLLIVRWRW